MLNTKKLIKIKTNTSNLRKVYFSEKYQDKWYLITYLLSKLLLAKQNFNIYNNELLIIMELLKIQKVYAKQVLKLNSYNNYTNSLQFITIK